MRLIEPMELGLVGGGKNAAVGKIGSGASAASASGSATISGTSNTSTHVTVKCEGKVETETVLWGAWQRTRCEPTQSTPKPPAKPASGSANSAFDWLKANYWEDNSASA
jgi:hypothetical protein